MGNVIMCGTTMSSHHTQFGKCEYVPPVHFTKRVYDAITKYLELHGQPDEYPILKLSEYTQHHLKGVARVVQHHSKTYITNYGHWIIGAGVNRDKIGSDMTLNKSSWQYDGVDGKYVTNGNYANNKYASPTIGKYGIWGNGCDGDGFALEDVDITRIQEMKFTPIQEETYVQETYGVKFGTDTFTIGVKCVNSHYSNVLPQIIELLSES